MQNAQVLPCARRGCDRDFELTVHNKKYCSESCKVRASQERVARRAVAGEMEQIAKRLREEAR